MRWDFASVFDNTDALLVGAAGTLRIFAICLVLGLSLGLLVGLGRFVEFFRNTPVLVQILWFYFALPILLPFQISPLAAASLGISLNSAAFSAEIYRGGIQSIETGQWDGARALGMDPGLVRWPSAGARSARGMLAVHTGDGVDSRASGSMQARAMSALRAALSGSVQCAWIWRG